MPRKTRDRPARGGRSRSASMRPRPDAAENILDLDRLGVADPGFNEAAARCRGKRRIRACRKAGCRRFNEAAARCRGKLRLPPHRPAVGQLASMRPRPDAAENSRALLWADLILRSFNEAAARCRGKPSSTGFGSAHSASCFNEAAARCRGKRTGAPGSSPARNCFNEAAARCRGKRPPTWFRTAGAKAGFNEAAARCRGKRAVGCIALSFAYRASMRPRPDAAENVVKKAEPLKPEPPLQ